MQHNVNISCNKKQENVHESPLMLSNTIKLQCDTVSYKENLVIDNMRLLRNTFQKNDL